MRVAYFDCFSGISGDMALGALVHAGADLDAVAGAVRSLSAEEFLLEQEAVEVHGIAALRLHVRSRPQGVIRTYANIRALIEDSPIPEEPKRMAQRVYRRLAEASARVHAKDVEVVTFHEYGELDCMVEIVGSAVALHLLEIDRIFASSVPTGLGMVRTEHGIAPIPSPVVLELLAGVPTYSRGIPVELVTPTGAAILSAASEGYGEMPLMLTEHVGYGAGHLRLDFPNVLRVVIGHEQRAGAGAWSGPGGGDVLIEAAIGLSDQETVEEIMARLAAAGAGQSWATAATGPDGTAMSIVSAVAPAGRVDGALAVLREAPLVGPARLSPVALSPGDRLSPEH